jgi:putative oxidoreductase
MSKPLQLSFLPRSADCALLALRLWFGLTLFFNHGLPKLLHFSDTSAHFPDPIGIGSTAALALALFAEVLCAALLVVGWATRLAALIIIIELGTAFFRIHHHRLAMGPGSGELAFLYLGAMVAILIAGAGKHSADGA